MKKYLTLFTFILLTSFVFGQTYNADYVHKLYAKYPTVKSSLCKSCKEFDNPIYKSIADTLEHRPVVTFYVYTKAHQDAQEKIKIDRKGIFAEWHPVTGQSELANVYSTINKPIKESINKWVWGHCQAWILLAYCEDGAILSDTEDFNEGMEVQGQNIGTEIATEEYCRTLLKSGKTTSINIWCGTFGNQGTATDGKIVVVIPAYYWKIIKYNNVTEAWWMPNKVTETTALLPQRISTADAIIKNIGFDPTKVLK